MKSLIILLLGVFSLSSFNTYGIDKVIYGKDDRIEMYQFNSSPLAYLGKSVAVMIEKKYLKKSSSRKSMEVSRSVKKLKDAYPFCGKESFDDQLTAGMCTGFLVHPKIIVTAGDCFTTFSKDMCKRASWVFGYKLQRRGDSSKMEFPKNNIYGCKKVWKEITDNSTGIDYAIVELDREVRDREPLSLNRHSTPNTGDRLVIIGHPMGLPLKVASNAKITKTGEVFFTTNLDSYQGNSGSPVFSLRTGDVEGILVRGKADFYTSRNSRCYKMNYCDEDGKNCDKESAPDGEEVLAVSSFKKELDKVLLRL